MFFQNQKIIFKNQEISIVFYALYQLISIKLMLMWYQGNFYSDNKTSTINKSHYQACLPGVNNINLA